MENQQSSTGNPYWDNASQTSSPSASSSTGNPYWDKPSDVQQGEAQLGNTDKNGFCEQWQEQVTGSPNMGTTAYNAWNNYIKNGQAYSGLQGAKQGDKVYFSGDGGLGHTGVISSIDPQGNAKFISATDKGVQEMPINDWIKQTGERLLGFVSSSK